MMPVTHGDVMTNEGCHEPPTKTTVLGTKKMLNDNYSFAIITIL